MAVAGLLVWAGLALGVLYDWRANWSLHVPPGSSVDRKVGVSVAYLLGLLVCLTGFWLTVVFGPLTFYPH